MTKKYVSRLSRLGICVDVNDVTVHVDFKPGFIDNNGNRGCVFVTDDKDLQKAIEAHHGFGDWRSKFYTNDKEEEPVSLDETANPGTAEPTPVKKRASRKKPK